MKALTQSQLKNRITAINGSYDPERIQEALANIVCQSLHGNSKPANQLKLDVLPAKIRSYLGKYCAVKYNKTAEHYDYNREKAEKIQASLGVDFKPAFEEVANALPAFDEKPEQKKRIVDSASSVESLVKRLEKALAEESVKDSAHAKKVLDTLKTL